jgi:hypothetical protein
MTLEKDLLLVLRQEPKKNRVIENSNVSGSPWSRFAPARKSAQIISKQYRRDRSLPSIRAAVSIARSISEIWAKKKEIFYGPWPI